MSDASKPIKPASSESGDFDKFRDFARQVMSVPRSAIQPQLDAEKERKRTSKTSASRVPAASSAKD
jgi:hypothetical protein